MRLVNFEEFITAYKNSDEVISIWKNKDLVAFGSMLTDYKMNSTIYDLIVTPSYQKKGYRK
jgi:hypothetical protein